jgi:phenylalanyl-tRNA synthetase alpha chain
MHDLKKLQSEILKDIQETSSLDDLEALRVRVLGKKGEITELMKSLGSYSIEERKTQGAALNAMKEEILLSLDHKKNLLEEKDLANRLMTESLDISLPGRPEEIGHLHPRSQTVEEVIAIFGEMGFSMATGPDIEEDFYNFTAVNIPPEHPARQMQDTFYLPPREDGTTMLLRTHTSPVQIRTMMNQKPPIQIISPGRVFRSDYDITHSPMFHQVEGLYIDKNITMSHLKHCLTTFLKEFFEIEDLPIRFRPSFFPFTEPSAEVDIGYSRKGGVFQIGKGDSWLEILGCGMVHPQVLKNCGIDPEEYQGFAFGMGIERIAMLKYGIPDLRTFFEGDVRWLKHFGFSALDYPSVLNGLRGGIGQ